MNDDIFQGYKGRALEVLQKYNARVWAKVKVDSTRGVIEGTILPRAENTDDKHIVMKFFTGYNIGVDIDTVLDIHLQPSQTVDRVIEDLNRRTHAKGNPGGIFGDCSRPDDDHLGRADP